MSRRHIVTLTFLAFSAASSLCPVQAQTQYYSALVQTQLQTYYPSSIDTSDSKFTRAPNTSLLSRIGLGFPNDPNANVQLVEAVAKPGEVGITAHGQTDIYLLSQSPDAGATSETASAQATDFTTVSSQNIGMNGKVHFFPYPLGDISAYFDQRVTTGDGFLSLRVVGDLTATNLTTLKSGEAKFEVDLNGNGRTIPIIPTITYTPTFDLDASSGDVIRFTTSSSAIIDAIYTGTYFNADFLHTFHTYIDSETPGVTLTSFSGHDYSTPAGVPEPDSPALLLGLATTGAGFLSRRRRQQARHAA